VPVKNDHYLETCNASIMNPINELNYGGVSFQLYNAASPDRMHETNILRMVA